MTKYDYIPTEFGRTWVASRTEARRGVYTPLSYIDINEGNRFDADVFAQIMYWHEPNTETHESRLTRQKDGSYWMTKNHSDWFKETRIKAATVRKCLGRLRDRKLIIYELHGEAGDVTPWIRVNWEEFERRIKLWIDNNVVSIAEKKYEETLVTLFHTPDTREQGGCPEISDTQLQGNTPLIPQDDSNTETLELDPALDFANTPRTPAPNGLGSTSTPPRMIDGLKGFYDRLEAEDPIQVWQAVEEKPSPVGELTTPPPPTSATPPASDEPEEFDMTHLRDVVAHKWFEFNKPKQLLSRSNQRIVKRLNPIIDTIVDTFPDATDDRHAWVALQFCVNWDTKKAQDGNKLSMPLDAGKFGIHWRKWLNEHPEIVATMGGQIEAALVVVQPQPAYATGVQSFSAKKGGA